MSLVESILHYTDLTVSQVEDEGALRQFIMEEVLRAKLKEEDKLAELREEDKVSLEDDWGLGKLQMEAFEACIEKRLIQPTFITHYPAEVSPLSRRNDDDPRVTDRFELFVAGRGTRQRLQRTERPGRPGEPLPRTGGPRTCR